MAEPRGVPRGTVAGDPLVHALTAAMREIAERRASEEVERRRTMRVVVGANERGGRAA